MIENLSQFWDKADGKTKKKILGCIFKEKFEDFNFERCNHVFTPEIKSIMLVCKVLQKNKNKKEVKNDLLSNMAPLIIQSCSSNLNLMSEILQDSTSTFLIKNPNFF